MIARVRPQVGATVKGRRVEIGRNTQGGRVCGNCYGKVMRAMATATARNV